MSIQASPLILPLPAAGNLWWPKQGRLQLSLGEILKHQFSHTEVTGLSSISRGDRSGIAGEMLS